MVRKVKVLGDPVLREEADEVVAYDERLRSLVRDMFETMYHEEGIGLAAPQIGVSQRVIFRSFVDARSTSRPAR